MPLSKSYDATLWLTTYVKHSDSMVWYDMIWYDIQTAFVGHRPVADHYIKLKFVIYDSLWQVLGISYVQAWLDNFQFYTNTCNNIQK